VKRAARLGVIRWSMVAAMSLAPLISQSGPAAAASDCGPLVTHGCKLALESVHPAPAPHTASAADKQTPASKRSSPRTEDGESDLDAPWVGIIVLLCASVALLLSLGPGRWYRYGQFAIATALGAWLVDGIDGLLVALAVLSVLLPLVEGILHGRSLPLPKLVSASEKYRSRLYALRADISLTMIGRTNISALGYFQLPCIDPGGEVHPSALSILLESVTALPPQIHALYGSFGTGKSTTCLELCLELLDRPNSNILPIYLPINAVGDQSPVDWLSDLVGRQYGLLNRTGDPSVSLTSDPRVCLIFDGLEGIDEYYTNPVSGPLLREADRVRRTPVVLSARRLDTALPFNEAEPASPASQLVDSWLGLLPLDTKAQQAYVAEIHQFQELRPESTAPAVLDLDILDRPFLIDLAYCATAEGAQVGTSLSSLYRAAIGVILTADAKDKATAPSPDVTKAALIRFAFQAYRQGQEQFPLDTAVDYIEADGTLDRAEIFAALNGCRLLTDYGGRVGFAHRSLEEFFVAMACLDAIRKEEWPHLDAFLLINPVFGFLVDLLGLAPDNAQLTARIADRFAQDVSSSEESGGHSLANLASLLSGLGRSMSGLRLEGRRLTGAALRNADLQHAQLVDVNLDGVDLSHADLSNAALERVDLRNSFIHDVDCHETRFVDCNFWNLRWLDEPPSLWAARWHRHAPILVCSLSTGHIVLLVLNEAHTDVAQSVSHGLGSTGVLDVDLDDAGSTLLASDRAGRVVEMRLSLSNKPKLTELKIDRATHAANVRRIRFAPAGRIRYATASRDGFVRLFLQGQSMPFRQHGRHRSPIMDLAWDHRGNLLASAGYDGQVYIWDVTTPYGQPVAAPCNHAKASVLRAVAFSPSGERLVAAGESGDLLHWEVDQCGQASSPVILASVPSAVFSLDFVSETCVVVGTWDGNVFLVKEGKARPIWRHREAVRAIDFAHGQIMSASWDGGIVVGTELGEPVTNGLHVPFPENPSAGRLVSRFSGAQMVRPLGLSPRFLGHLEDLGVEVQPLSE
jgi:WD40 repeat protein